MTSRALSFAGAVAAALAITSAAAVSRAAGDDEAREKQAQALFDAGVAHADNGDVQRALASFRASYEKHPNVRVLYTIGKLCVRVGDAACAVRAYEQYLREARDVSPKRRKELEAEVKALSRTLGAITITANESGAEVSVDDVVVGKTPLSAPVAVNGGRRKIVVTKDGRSAEKTVTVVAGESASVDLDLAKDEAPTAATAGAPAPKKDDAAAPAEPAKHNGATPRSFPVVPWAVTGALAGATLVSGFLAASAYSDFQGKRDEFPITRDDLEGAQGTARDLFLLTTFLGAGTLMSLGVAGYLTWFASDSAGPAPSKARVGVAIAPGVVGLHGALP